MLDNLLNSVKKGAEKVQRRGEEVAQIARLKMEIFQLSRELDGHYARLGRAYHDGKDVDILSGIREDTGERVVALCGSGGYAEVTVAPEALSSRAIESPSAAQWRVHSLTSRALRGTPWPMKTAGWRAGSRR